MFYFRNLVTNIEVLYSQMKALDLAGGCHGQDHGFKESNIPVMRLFLLSLSSTV